MFKKIKKFFEGLKSLENRVTQLENKIGEMWEESHPRTMGGK